MNYKEIINQADDWARKEFTEHGVPMWAYETANKSGKKLAEYFNVNKDIILLGTILMDIAIGRALTEGRLSEHIEMSHKDAADFLNKYDIKDEDKIKILDGVKFHHGTEKFPSLESEIIMNADCYKFLIPENMEDYLRIIQEERGSSKEEAINLVEKKFLEKKNGLTLDYCKEELKENIEIIKRFLKNI
jgi:hypothetical protein